LSSGFHTVEIWKPDVQQNQVRLQFFTLPDRIQAIGTFADNYHVQVVTEKCANSTAPCPRVIHDKSTNCRQLSEASFRQKFTQAIIGVAN
jgi:hypothetical protein